MNTIEKSMYEWKDINWHKVERCVFKMQKRIFRASQQDNVKLVHKLQRLLTESWYSKLLAVRRVSQDNQGKKTAGTDGVKSLRPTERITLVNQLKLGNKSKPTRRVWIPKPGTDERRPLGIPTMNERALQALVKLALADTIAKHKSSPQVALIKEANPIIRGWSNYYSPVVSKETYSYCDNILYYQLRRWGKRRHPNKSLKWVHKKYWNSIGTRNWVFSTRGDEKAYKLSRHSDVKIVRHTKVKGEKSPFDGDLTYWSSRMGSHPEMPSDKATLLKKQKGRCAYCGLTFRDGDLMEIDHITPKSLGGNNHRSNKQLLHHHCHDKKTAKDGSSTHDKRLIIEEPCEAKVSRTVLKTSQRGDSLA
ncbi:reverse transcriptase N-terminal domain-containing protein [Limnoraphis robusta]|jgi:RNA-directed DNA polymerase|uniref:reverse transcriptase N-terminal domain-containing protein n=1 Tax=Limnoraphis robusta TaxID=1118279 RepID=UPI00069D3249|nr:reverse transcriptase N-terminal domain-containing protein [Limnoraphis robusta]